MENLHISARSVFLTARQCAATRSHMNHCELKNRKKWWIFGNLKVFAATTPVDAQSPLPSQLCRVGKLIRAIVFSLILISQLSRKLLEDNDDLRVIFLIRCNKDQNKNQVQYNSQRSKKTTENNLRDPRGTVTHDGQPRGNKLIDSFCSNLLDDLVKVHFL